MFLNQENYRPHIFPISPYLKIIKRDTITEQINWNINVIFTFGTFANILKDTSLLEHRGL